MLDVADVAGDPALMSETIAGRPVRVLEGERIDRGAVREA
jgi:hypothetical protein